MDDAWFRAKDFPYWKFWFSGLLLQSTPGKPELNSFPPYYINLTKQTKIKIQNRNPTMNKPNYHLLWALEWGLELLIQMDLLFPLISLCPSFSKELLILPGFSCVFFLLSDSSKWPLHTSCLPAFSILLFLYSLRWCFLFAWQIKANRWRLDFLLHVYSILVFLDVSAAEWPLHPSQNTFCFRTLLVLFISACGSVYFTGFSSFCSWCECI